MQWGDGGPSFYNCDVPFDLWCYVFWMFGLQLVLLEKVPDLLCGWREIDVLSNMWSASHLDCQHLSLVLFLSDPLL